MVECSVSSSGFPRRRSTLINVEFRWAGSERPEGNTDLRNVTRGVVSISNPSGKLSWGSRGDEGLR